MKVENKNICITINSLVRGGAEKQCLLLAKALKAYHNIIVVILDSRDIHPPRLKDIEEEALNHIFLSTSPIKRALEFIKLLKKRKIDILFSFLPTDTIWAAVCGRVAGVPYILGGIRNSYLPWFKFAALRMTHNYMLNYTIANNYAVYRSSIEFGFKKKVLVVHNGIEIRPIPKRLATDKKTIVIISVGRLVKQKDYETAIRAIAELKKTLNGNYRIHYKIVGIGPEQERMVDSIEKYGVQEEAEIITNPSNIYALLESSDIYLCTSAFEGVSNSIMEAMNCALPIVATDAGDNKYLVIHDISGFISVVSDFRKLSDYMCRLTESSSLRHQMGLESYNHLVNSFGFGIFQTKYLSLIKNIEAFEIDDGDPVFPN